MMDARRRMARLVLEDGWTISAAALESGVSRQTAHEWVKRARVDGLGSMQEKSRRPNLIRGNTGEDVVAEVLAIAAKYPDWGPKTLYPLLWKAGTAPVCERTVARILARQGRRVIPAGKPKQQDVIRFERRESNELWQTDFKRVGHHRCRLDSLTILDDARRFCIASCVLPDQTLESAWSVLWEAFAEFGLPQQILSDNGSAFRNNATWRWSLFDLRLLLLGIRTTHGRPYHPQTQGKVERFHKTIEAEVHFSKHCDVQKELSVFRDRYNWVRPHHSLAMRTPGSLYSPSARKRPQKMPEPYFPEGAVIRRCQNNGTISYKGKVYRVGKALIGLPIGILDQGNDSPKVVWGNFTLAKLEDLKV